VNTHSPKLSDRQRVSAAVHDKINENEHVRIRDRYELALDQSRRKYWLKMGRFFESRFGRLLHFWIDVLAFIILTSFFTASLILNVYISETLLEFWGVSHSQYIAGIVTLVSFHAPMYATYDLLYR
jgi:hypothetical protein